LDIYHIWCDLKPGVKDTDFLSHARAYFEHLQSEKRLVAYRITRKKLGLAGAELGEFHIMLEFESLAHLDQAFEHVAARTGEVESFHHAVNSKVTNARFALYRDFPDAVRITGAELF